MITRKLWRALRTPPFAHPMFRRRQVNPPVIIIRKPESRSRKIWAIAGGVVFICILSIPLAFVAAFLIPLLIILLGTISGLICAVRVSSILVQTKEQRAYDLLSISPSGALGASWAACAGYLHHSPYFRRLFNLLRQMPLILLGVTVIGVILALIPFLNPVLLQNDGTRIETVPSLIPAGILAVTHLSTAAFALYFDSIQSIIMGGLVAMLVPTYVQSRTEARPIAVGIFLALQMVVYSATWLGAMIILSSSFESLALDGLIADLSLPVLRVLVLVIIRELIIMTVWQVLALQLNTDTAELDVITRIAV